MSTDRGVSWPAITFATSRLLRPGDMPTLIRPVASFRRAFMSRLSIISSTGPSADMSA